MLNLIILFSYMLYITLFLLQCNPIMCWDYEFQRVESLNKTSSTVDFNLKAKRKDRSTYALSGTIEYFFAGKDADTFLEVKAYYSAKGNNQFVLSPMKVPNQRYCDFINTTFRKYLMASLKEPVSDYPYTDDENENLCYLLEKKKYTVNNYLFDKSLLPKFMPTGLYKVHLLFNTGDVITGGVEILAKIVDD